MNSQLQQITGVVQSATMSLFATREVWYLCVKDDDRDNNAKLYIFFIFFWGGGLFLPVKNIRLLSGYYLKISAYLLCIFTFFEILH